MGDVMTMAWRMRIFVAAVLVATLVAGLFFILPSPSNAHASNVVVNLGKVEAKVSDHRVLDKTTYQPKTLTAWAKGEECIQYSPYAQLSSNTWVDEYGNTIPETSTLVRGDAYASGQRGYWMDADGYRIPTTQTVQPVSMSTGRWNSAYGTERAWWVRVQQTATGETVGTWVDSTSEAITAHGRTSAKIVYDPNAPASDGYMRAPYCSEINPSNPQNLREKQSGFGFKPSAVNSVKVGQPFLLGTLKHYNVAVYISDYGQLYSGALSVKFLGQQIDFPWLFNETDNRPCAFPGCDDQLKMTKVVANRKVTVDGVDYRLVLNDFRHTSNTCPTTLSSGTSGVQGGQITFTTVERRVSTGCLYATLEQVRPLTIVKKVEGAEAGTTIPNFAFNTTANSPAGVEEWEDDFTLRPTATTQASRTEDVLTPLSRFSITETSVNDPKWRLKELKCVDGRGQAVSGISTSGATITVSGVEPETFADAVRVTCTYVNEYLPDAKLTLVKVVQGGPLENAVGTGNWTLSATSPKKTISGISGATAVTGVTVPAGTYSLQETVAPGVTGFTQTGSWRCVNRAANNVQVPVTNGSVTLTDKADVVCTVTNTFQTGAITITKQVVDPFQAVTDTQKEFTGTYDCGVVNNKAFRGNWSVRAGSSTTISGLPAGSDCHLAEHQPTGGLKDSSYRWVGSFDRSAPRVPVGPTAAQVRLTNTVTQDTGTVVVKKQIQPESGAENGYTGGMTRSFDVAYSCRVPNSPQTVTGTVSVPANATGVQIPNLPAGAVCSFTETAPVTQAADFVDTSYEWTGPGAFSPQTVTVVKDRVKDTTVTNTYRRVFVDLTVAKNIEGAGFMGGSTPFAIDYECSTGVRGTLQVANGQTQTVQVPRNSLCRVVEQASAKNETLLDAAYDWKTETYTGLDAAGDPTRVNAANGGKTVTVTNKTVAAWGKISVTKSVMPDTTPVNQGTTFPITVTCDRNAQGGTAPYSQVFNLAAGQVGTTSYLPAGAACTVSEAAPSGSEHLKDGSYAWDGQPNEQQVTVPGADIRAVTVTNTWKRVYGSLTITKDLTDLDGQGADNTYTGTWICQHAGDADVTGTWRVSGNGQARLEGPTDKILFGSACSATEGDPGRPNDVDPSYIFSVKGAGNGVAATASPNADVMIGNTVSRTTGGITITKQVDGAAAGIGFADTAFTFTYTCTPKSGTTITGRVTTQAGQSAQTITGIPEGATCTIAEVTDALPTPIDPYRWNSAETTWNTVPSQGNATTTRNVNAVTFDMPGGQNPGVAVTATNKNTMRYGAVTVTKVVAADNKANGFTGGSNKIFPITLTCGDLRKDVMLADGESAVLTGIPLGRQCSVTEGTVTTGLTDGSYVWGMPEYSTPVTVTTEGERPSGTLTITNKITRVRADIGLTKNLSGELATTFGVDNPYSGTFTCTHAGDADVTGTWSVAAGSGRATIAYDGGLAPYVDSECTPTENLNASNAPDVDPSYSWGSPTVEKATVLPDGSGVMTVTNTVVRDEGTLSGAKIIAGENNGLKDDASARTFTLNATCTAPGVTGDLTATATVTAGQKGVAFDKAIPAGWQCRFSETTPTHDQLKDQSYTWSSTRIAPETVVIEKGKNVEITATNTIARVNAQVTVNKVYGQMLAQDPSIVINDAFAGAVTCRYDDQQGTTGSWNGTWSINGQGQATVSGLPAQGVPVGSICSATENVPTQLQLRDISYRWKSPQVSSDVTIVNGVANTITVTNDVERVEQPLTIIKEYSGLSGALVNNAEVNGAWSCTQADGSKVGGRWTLPATGGRVTVSHGDDRGSTLLAGATCTVTEDTLTRDLLTDKSYEWLSPAYASATDGTTFVENTARVVSTTQNATPTVKVTNATTRIYGALNIMKYVEGLDGVAAASTNTYGGTWSCTAEDSTVNHGSWRINGAGTAEMTSEAGSNYQQILVGSTCTVVENTRPTSPVSNDVSYIWVDPQQDANYGTVVQAAEIDKDRTSTASVTNSADRRIATHFTASKTITGATDGTSKRTYAVDYSCTAGVDTYNGTISVTDGATPTHISGVPTGATCTLSESGRNDSDLTVPANGSYTWTNPVSYTVNGTTAPTLHTGTATFTLPADSTGVSVNVINDIVPHAGVNKEFIDTRKHLDANGAWTGETWDMEYLLTVSNPSAVAPLTYTLTDTPTVPAGTTLNSVSVTPHGGQTTTITTPTSGSPIEVARDIVLPANTGSGTGIHTYTVILNVSAPDTGVPGVADDACGAQAAQDGTAVHNQAAVTSSGVTHEARDCGNVPINPKFSVKKDKVDVSRQGETYTATYLVTVQNTSRATSPIIADVTDIPSLPESASLTGIKVMEKGQEVTDALIPTITGGKLDRPLVLARAGTGEALAGGQQQTDGTITGGGTRVFTVSMSFTINSAHANFDETAYMCQRTPQGTYSAGVLNTASMVGDTDGDSNNTACQELTPRLKIQKEFVSSDAAPGKPTFNANYRITVTNEGEIAQNTGVITDMPDFATGLSVDQVRVATTEDALERDASIVAILPNGYTITNGTVVAPAETHVFFLRIRTTLDPSAAHYSEDLLSCATQEDGSYQNGRGLFNAITVDAAKDHDGSANNTACGPVSPDSGKRPLTIRKTGSQGFLEGATFDIYPSDPTIAGAQPIANGVVVDPADGSRFTTVALDINRDYWLVETRAPLGHQLMPRAVKFHLTVDTITLNDTQLGVDMITVSKGGATEDTITVKDVEVGALPLTGGSGVILYILTAALLFAAAAGLFLAPSRRRDHKPHQ